jgi:hypothetical protein
VPLQRWGAGWDVFGCWMRRGFGGRDHSQEIVEHAAVDCKLQVDGSLAAAVAETKEQLALPENGASRSVVSQNLQTQAQSDEAWKVSSIAPRDGQVVSGKNESSAAFPEIPNAVVNFPNDPEGADAACVQA